jgi:hypothetical protein
MAKKIRPIKYTSRDFDTIKEDLIEYAKRYYPDTFRDFNEASFGSMLLDTVSYVGDVLSFYLDYQVNESFMETAIQYDSIVKIGRQLGYKFRGSATAHGTVALYIVAPAASTGLGPDTNYLPILKRGSTFSSTGGGGYILNQNVNFANSENEVVVAEVDSSTGLPTSYAVRAYGQVISGEMVRETVEIGSFQRFARIEIPGSNISEIISVIDSEGHRYYEVDYLSQNTVFVEVTNQGSDRDTVRTILKPIIVPRRFTVEQEFGRTFLQFGHGSEDNLTSDLIVDPSNITLDINGKDFMADTSFDPSRLTKTDKFGIAPANTTLVVAYRINPAGRVNAAVNTVTNVGTRNFVFPSVQEGVVLDSSKQSTVTNSLEVANQRPVVGGVSTPTAEELKSRIQGNHSAQNRAVTRQDYISMIYSMPPQLGAIKRINIVQDTDSFKRNLNIYVISEDINGKLVTSNSTIKSNVKNWIKRYKMINDTVDILDAYIINIGIEFSAVAVRSENKFDVVQRAVALLGSRLTSKKRDIGERFYITDIYSTLRLVQGLLDVVDVKITLKTGGKYSNTGINLDELIDPDGRYIDIPENVILEIKYPNADIKGTIL